MRPRVGGREGGISGFFSEQNEEKQWQSGDENNS